MTITAADAMNQALEMCDDLGFDMAPGFSTHWAMGSETLIQLGHPDHVEEWVQRYRRIHKHFPRPESRSPINSRDESSWRSALGDFERAGDWQIMFERDLSERPWREVILDWWPRLMPSLGAGLTHGLIRTTHAVRSIVETSPIPSRLHLRELATGLAYWASKFSEQAGQSEAFGGAHLPELLSEIPRLDPNEKIGLLQKGGFRHLSDIKGWSEKVSTLSQPSDIDVALSEITLSFAQVNLAHTDQFPIPLIHSVTAPAAVRLMLQHLPEEMHLPSFAAAWRTSAALLSTFALEPREGEVRREEKKPVYTKQQLVERAVDHGDEHAIKLTEACLREHVLLPDDTYLVLAETMIDRIPRPHGGAAR